jgi:hypothetical protein
MLYNADRIWQAKTEGVRRTVQKVKQLGRGIVMCMLSSWLAGAGVKRGYVHGATNEHGIRAVEKPVHVHDFHAIILHLLGLDHTRLTYRHAGRDYRLTDVHGEVVKEILA